MFYGIKAETIRARINTLLKKTDSIILNFCITCIKVRQTAKTIVCNIISVFPVRGVPGYRIPTTRIISDIACNLRVDCIFG